MSSHRQVYRTQANSLYRITLNTDQPCSWSISGIQLSVWLHIWDHTLKHWVWGRSGCCYLRDNPYSIRLLGYSCWRRASSLVNFQDPQENTRSSKVCWTKKIDPFENRFAKDFHWWNLQLGSWLRCRWSCPECALSNLNCHFLFQMVQASFHHRKPFWYHPRISCT